jgi:hypothetical protein
MKFIFPQNYNFSSKIFGFIDYSTAILNVIWCGLLFIILHIFFDNLNIKIFLFITLALPLILFSILGFNGENITYFFIYIFKYIFKPKIYFFKKC